MEYCIMCERVVFTNHPYLWGWGNRQVHPKFEVVTTPNEPNVIFCTGPFASCPPPELPADWEAFVTEPDPEELKRMDIHAMELAFQLEQ